VTHSDGTATTRRGQAAEITVTRRSGEHAEIITVTKHGTVRVAGAPDRIAKHFQVTGLSKVFGMHP
jgi:hypothetical protein